MGVIAFAVERSPGIRQACCEDVTVCLTILRGMLSRAGNPMLSLLSLGSSGIDDTICASSLNF